MSSLETHAGRAIGRMLFVTLLGCLVASIAGRNMPAPLAATAAPEKFSAERAQAVVAEIARAPHPTGSKDQARVRSFLLERLRSLGFAAARSEERRVGKECCALCRSRWSPYH